MRACAAARPQAPPDAPQRPTSGFGRSDADARAYFLCDEYFPPSTAPRAGRCGASHPAWLRARPPTGVRAPGRREAGTWCYNWCCCVATRREKRREVSSEQREIERRRKQMQGVQEKGRQDVFKGLCLFVLGCTADKRAVSTYASRRKRLELVREVAAKRKWAI